MNVMKMSALVLIVVGAIVLIYGSFAYTQETQKASLGHMHLMVNEEKTVNIPVSAGIAAVLVGGVLLVLGTKRSSS